MSGELENKEKPHKDEKAQDDKVILKVDMHCQACKEKVRKSLMGFPGLEKIDIDMKTQKVTVKGKVDAKMLFQTVRKKSGRPTELLFPQLSREEEEREERKQQKQKEMLGIDSILKTIDSITALFTNTPDVTVVLKVNMHCAGCAKEVQRTLERMDGVCDVKVDLQGEKVTVRGKNLDPNKVCDRVIKKTGKHAAMVPAPKTDETKQEKKGKQSEKTEEKKAEKSEEKKAEESEEKKEDRTDKKQERKKENAEKEDKKEKKQERKKEKEEENGEKEDDDKKSEQKKSQYIPAKSIPEYAYPPQLFSDENPNACSTM